MNCHTPVPYTLYDNSGGDRDSLFRGNDYLVNV